MGILPNTLTQGYYSTTEPLERVLYSAMEEALFQSRLTTTIFSCFQPLLIPFHLSIWDRCFNHRLYLHFQLQSHFRVSECTSDIFSDTELTRNSDQNSNLLKLCILHLLIKLYNFHYFASPNSAYFALETSYKLLPRRQNLLRPRAAEIFPRASGASTAKRGAIGKIPNLPHSWTSFHVPRIEELRRLGPFAKDRMPKIE